MSAPAPADAAKLAAKLALGFVGPVVAGVVANAFLLGVVIMQYTTYFRSKYRDPIHVRATVYWLVALDLFSFGVFLELLWSYAVNYFGNVSAILNSSKIGYTAIGLLVAGSSVPVQLCLAYRVKVLSGKLVGNLALGFVAVLCAVELAMGTMSTVCFANAKMVRNYRHCIVWGTVAFPLAILIDLFLTVLLFIYLKKSRSHFKDTNNMITSIIIRSVETCAFVTVFCAGSLIFLAFPGTAANNAFAMPIGRVYSITLMTNLNSRGNYHRSGVSTSRSAGATDIDAPIHISVQRETQRDFPMNKISTKTGSDSETQFDRKIGAAGV